MEFLSCVTFVWKCVASVWRTDVGTRNYRQRLRQRRKMPFHSNVFEAEEKKKLWLFSFDVLSSFATSPSSPLLCSVRARRTACSSCEIAEDAGEGTSTVGNDARTVLEWISFSFFFLLLFLFSFLICWIWNIFSNSVYTLMRLRPLQQTCFGVRMRGNDENRYFSLSFIWMDGFGNCSGESTNDVRVVKMNEMAKANEQRAPPTNSLHSAESI